MNRKMARSRGKPFPPGNKLGRGRPKGSRNKANQIVNQVFQEHLEAVSKKCCFEAMHGDTQAMKIVLDRTAPAPKELPVKVRLPQAGTQQEDLKNARAILAAAANGQITPTQAQQMASVAERVQQARESEIEARLKLVEKQVQEMEEKLKQSPAIRREDLPKAS
jgi:hypothetical protein